MSSVYLKPSVHSAAVGPDLVLLDVEGDAYFCVPGGADMFGDEGRLRVSGSAWEEALQKERLLTNGSRRLGSPIPAAATRTIIHHPAPLPHAVDWVHGLGAALELRRMKPAGGLRHWLEIRPSRHPLRRDPEEVIAVAHRFWRLAPWLPLEGECLARSALLMRYLARHGLAADWMFGIRLWPFMAHCWVQCGDLCLNDDWERLTAFTPIMRR